MIRSWVLATLAALLVVGCFDRTHDFKLRFHDVHGLKKGDPIYFDGSVIGDVQEIEYTDAGLFLVSVAIQKEFAPAATANSRFYIDADPEKAAQKGDPGRSTGAGRSAYRGGCRGGGPYQICRPL